MPDVSRTHLLGRYAGFVSRLFAFGIDSVILTVITIAGTWASISALMYVGVDVRDCPEMTDSFDAVVWGCHAALLVGVAIGALFPTIYTVFFWSATGQTPGKAVMGVRVVRLDGLAMNLTTSLLRIVGYSISLSTLGTGFLWMLVDDRRQGLADKLAGTCVVYAWDETLDRPR